MEFGRILAPLYILKKSLKSLFWICGYSFGTAASHCLCSSVQTNSCVGSVCSACCALVPGQAEQVGRLLAGITKMFQDCLVRSSMLSDIILELKSKAKDLKKKVTF